MGALVRSGHFCRHLNHNGINSPAMMPDHIVYRNVCFQADTQETIPQKWLAEKMHSSLPTPYTVCNRRPGTFDELLELGAARVARPVLRGGGGSDITSLPNHVGVYGVARSCTPSLLLIPTTWKSAKILSFQHGYERVLPWSPLFFSISWCWSL
jgi:hypothetical protein